jgi:hypothetical protein
MEVNFGGKQKSQHKIRIVWMLDENRSDEKPILVFKRYTLSLHEKSALRKDLEAWRGKAFTPTELEGFDVETIIGVGCMVSIVHATKDGITYANVAAVMKLGKGMHAPQVRDYIRVIDRPKETEAIGESSNGSDSDMPDNWPDSETPF